MSTGMMSFRGLTIDMSGGRKPAKLAEERLGDNLDERAWLEMLQGAQQGRHQLSKRFEPVAKTLRDRLVKQDAHLAPRRSELPRARQSPMTD